MYLLFPKWALRSMFDGLTQAIPGEQTLSSSWQQWALLGFPSPESLYF